MSKTILFLDTETTGLPTNWKAPYNEWPRMVSLAYSIGNRAERREEREFIIKPEGYEIPLEASNIHGITNEKANQFGIPIEEALRKLDNLIHEADLVVFHNSSFDTGIISGEQIRAGLKPEELIHNNPKIFCTKEKSTNICKIPGNRGGAWKLPSLAEICAFCGVENKGAHNALNDVIATKECYFYMVEQGYF